MLALTLVPVVVFLAVLVLMDSFKLVRPFAILVAISWGGLAAFALEPVHRALVTGGYVDAQTLVRYVAPAGEEVLKAGFVLLLLARHRIGFLVDAAVQGFAVGAGFALVENASYLAAMPDAPALVWIVRGFGTAVLHGGTTAIVAILAKSWLERQSKPRTVARCAFALLPGLALSTAVHSAYNHLLLPPVASTLLLLIALPLLLLAVFERSERATSDWVGGGMDMELARLDELVSEEFSSSNYGRYLQELKGRFDGPVVADMVCLLRLQLELSVQARALVMARQAGLSLPPDPDLAPALDEVAALRRAIGVTGMMALRPLALRADQDAFHRNVLTRK